MAFAGRMRRLVDCHCHVHDEAALIQNIADVRVGVLALMGVQPSNWELLDTAVAMEAERISQPERERLIPCYGMHPWFAHEHLPEESPTDSVDKPQWYHELRKRLEECPRAVVGEIGLDKAARSKGGAGTRKEMWKGQMNALEVQMALAAPLTNARASMLRWLQLIH